jgi:hypothetical protein
MKKPLPDGAGEIFDLRMNKKMVPNEIVFVSMVGDLSDGNWIVYVDTNKNPESYEWIWARDLQICLVYDASVHRDLVKHYAETIAKAKPNGGYIATDNFHGYLYLWNVNKQAGAHLTYRPEINGDIELGLITHPAEAVYRRVYDYELEFLLGVDSVK